MASKSNPPSDKQRELQHDRPSVTNRAWGESGDAGDQSFGKPGQGGYGDFRTHEGSTHEGSTREGSGIRDIDDAPVSDGPRADDRLREAVADRLVDNDRLDANQVLVAAEDGVVTLTGEVREAWMKDCAEDIARTVTGVREVRNVVRCDDGSASFGAPGEAVRSDGALPATGRLGRDDR